MDRRRSPWRSAAAWLLLAGLFGGAPQAQAVEVTVLSATLTVEAGGNVGTSYEGYCLDAGGTGTGTPCLGFAGTSVAAHGGLSDTTFELDGTTYTIKSLRWGSETYKEVGLTLDQDLADDITLTDLTLEMETPGGTTHTFEFSAATLDVLYPHQDIENQYYWSPFPQDLLNLTDTNTVSVKIIYDSDEVADDVTLSALSLVEGSNTITLSPTFASATTDYTAEVANGVETITVTATKNTSAATVTISPTDAGSATGHQVGLAVGTNTITATVAHGSTTGAYTVVVTRAEAGNNPAGGAVTIDGGAQEGITLSVDTSGITDDDGLTSVSYSYQWLQVDGSTTTEINSATSSTYTVANGDVGKTLRVKVDFEDDAMNPETLTSAATDPVIGKTMLSFEAATYTATEGGGIIEVILQATPPMRQGYEGDLRVSLQGGATAADYNLPPRFLYTEVLSPSAADAVIETGFQVTALDDTEDDDGESILLSLPAMLPAWVTAGTQSQTTVNLVDDDHPEVTVEFDASTYAVTEGSTAVVTVDLSAAPERTVTIQIMTTNQGGAAAADYSGVASSLTFDATETSMAFTVTATDDMDDDDGESVKLDFASLPTRITTGVTGSATINLTDNDGAEVTVSFGSSSYTATEGGSDAAVAVSLSSALTVQVVVPIDATDQGGASSGDYSTVPSNLTFAAGDTSKTFTVTATDDAVDDDDESVKLSFGTLPTELGAGGVPETTIALADDDVPDVTVSFGAATYTVDEGGSVAVTVALSEAPERSVTIPIAAENLGLTSDADYSGVPSSVVFAATEASRRFTIAATDDAVDDDGESVKISFGTGSLPSQVTSGSPSETTVSITDNDSPPQLSFSDASASEGDPINFEVTLGAASGKTVTVAYATSVESGDTASTSDFTDTDGTLTFAPGTTALTVTVPTTQDTTDEADETFTLTLSSATNAALPSDTTKTGTITNDDTAGALSVQDASAEEGDPINFEVTLPAASGQTVTVNYATSIASGDTAASNDFTAKSGVLTFMPGTTTLTATVSTTEDTADENDETFTLTLSSVMNAMLPSDPTATGTITDNDDPPTLSSGVQSAGEGSNVTFTVTLSLASGKTVTVAYATADDTNQAVAGTDYTATSGTLTFAPGETSKPVAVPTTQDTTDEDNERFLLTLTNPSNATLSGGVSTLSYQGTITDNDAAPTLGFSDASASEGDPINFEVTLDAASGKEVKVAYATSIASGDTAESGDFTATSGTLTFAVGTTTLTVAVPTTQDETDEADETFTLTLSGASNATLPSDTTKTGTITNDDTAGALSVQDASAEEGNEVTFTVTLPAASGKTVRVSYAAAVGTDDTASSNDFTAKSGVLTFMPGTTSRTATVSTTEDTADEDDETFTLTLSNVMNAMLPTPATATGTITDDDDPPDLDFSDATASEGSNVNFTVTLSPASGKTVTVDYATSIESVDTTASGDFTALDDTLTFAPGDTSKQVVAQTTMDTIDEDNETFTLTLSNASNADLPADPARTGTITDNDNPPTLTLAVDDNEINEGDASLEAVLTAMIMGSQYAEDREVTLEFSGTATRGASGDYTVSAITLTIDAETTGASEMATVTVIDDDVDEAVDRETVIATLKLDGTAVDELTITVVDDDVRGLEVVTTSGGGIILTETNTNILETYTLALTSEPTEAVTVALSVAGNDPLTTVPTVSPGSLTFTPSDWATAKTATVTVRPDADWEEEHATITHAVSSGGDYGSSENEALPVVVHDDEAKSTTVTLSTDSPTLAEDAGATAVTVTAALNLGAFKTAVTVTVELSAGANTEAEDYTAPASLTLTIAAQETAGTATITITPTDDALWEPELERLILNPTMDTESLSPSGTPIVLDDDDAEPLLAFTASATEMAEAGGSVELEVAITNGTGFETEQTVNLNYAGGNATTGPDYQVTPLPLARMTLPAGAGASVTKTLTAVDDEFDEDDGTAGLDAEDERIQVQATYNYPSAGNNRLDTTHRVAILDDDHPLVMVSFDAPAYTAAEGGSTALVEVEFTVANGDDPERDIVIPITQTLLGGASAADYSGVPASVTIPADGTQQSFTVTATDDAIDDDGEGVRLGFTPPVGDDKVDLMATISTTTVSFTDNDERGLFFSPPSLRQNEGETNKAYQVRLTSEPTSTVTLSLQGGSLNLTDGPSGPALSSLTFTASNWSQAQTVTVLALPDGDSVTEDLTIGHQASGGDYGSVSETYTVTVVDLTTPATSVSLEASYTKTRIVNGATEVFSDNRVAEDAGTASVRVTARVDGAALATATTVTVTLSPGTASASDYTANPSTFTLVIAALAFSANRDVSLTPVDDGEEEGDETIVMSATVSGSLTVSSLGEFVIEDNDVRGVTVTVSPDTPLVLNLTEGASGTYTVSLNSTPSGTVTVAVSSDTPSVTASPAELVFTPTDTGPKTVTATAEQDADASNERATLSHAVSGADYGSVEAESVRVNVDDDEVGSSGINLSLNPAMVEEGEGATAVEVTATLDGGSLLQDVTVTVNLAPGTALASDYGLDRSRLSIVIAAGQASGTATVTLTPTADGVDEDEQETITVTGTSSNGLPVTGVTLAITDDDTRGVTVTPTSLSLREGEAPGTYAVSLDSEPRGSVTVMATVAGDAEASVRVSPTTLVFTATNYGAQTVTVRARGDRDQLGGTVTVSHAVSGADYVAQTADDVTVTVTDTGVVQWDVELSVDDVSALPEGGGARTVNVMAALLTGVQTAAVAVQVEVTPGGSRPASANDFRASPSRFTLTIPAGQEEVSRPLTLTPTDDGVDEGDETLVIAPSVADHLTTNEGGVELTITDDDMRGVTVAPTTLALDEGARGTYTVSLGSQPESSVTVSVTVSGSDSVTASPSSLVFTGSSWRQARAVTVQAQPDPGPNDENATLSHAVTGGDYEREGVTTAAAVAVTVTVTDDDKPSEAVRLTVTPDTVSEGAGATTLTVTGTLDAAARTDEMTVSVTIPAALDYTAVDAELTITAGATSGRASLTLTPVNDAVDADDDITVTVNATTTAQATLTDGTMQAMRLENADGSAPLALTVTIRDDDERGVTVTPTTLEVREDETATYTVALRTEPDGGAVVVAVSLADDDPNATTDASVVPSSLTFMALDMHWSMPQTVTVSVANDDAVELDATATVSHAASGADYGLHNVTAAAVTITVPGYELTADGGVQLRVPPSGMVTVPSGTPAPAGLNVSVPAGHRGKTVTVRTTTTMPGDDPPGFRLLGDSDTIVDIDGVTLGSGETATVCLPTTSEEGNLSVQRWDETAMEWVNLDAPSGGSPSGQVCGETDHFSIFAVMVRLEEPRLVLSADTLTIEIGEEDGAAYTVALTIAPAGSVTVSVSASAPAAVKLAVAPDTLVFTDSDYGVKTVTVTALEDAEAGEAVLVHEASGGRYLAPWHAELTVTVEEDTGLLTRAQKAWLARFGRTLATHVMEAVGERISAGPAVETKLSLGGSQPGTALLSGALKALAGESRPDGRRMLAESSFVLPLSGGGGDGSVTAWGRGAYTEFDGEESGLAIDGEVASGLFGVDWDQGRWRLGLLLSHSEGDGEIRERDGEAVDLESTLTGVHPYARYETEGGLMAWGVLGYGEGELERKKDGESSEVDIDLRMAAFGVEGELGEIEIGSGVYGLKLKSDVMAMRMEADGDEQLPGVEADASRVRLLLEGSGHCPLESGGVLRPALEAGLRFDEGDAETGLGVELGATLRYADATGRLRADLGARALVAHEENDYDEWGVSGALVLEPDRAGRGLSLSLGSSYGATQSGTDELWSRKELSGISETQGAAPGSRFEARLGYGLNAADGRGVLTPYAGYERQGAESTWRLGSQLTLRNELEFQVEGSLQHGGEEPEHGLAFTVSGRW